MRAIKLTVTALVSLLVAAVLVSCDGPTGPDTGYLLALGKNADLTGPHYNLNLIGVPRDKSASMDDNNGHRIFVKLWGTSKIYLQEGAAFNVIDANATDGNGGRFQLPNPDPENDGYTAYSVWARALGKPGGTSTTKTCANYTETLDDGTTTTTEYCSMYAMVMVRNTGKSRWENVSKKLLYVYQDIDGDGRLERYPLFHDTLEDYFWEHDNKGLKLVQLRFYEMETNVN